MKRSRLTLKALAVLVLVGGVQSVRADMGSVAVESATMGSITINWTDPSVGHRLAPDSPFSYKIGWEPAGSYPYLALPGDATSESRTVSGNDKKPFVISGLKPDTAYNITVDAFAERQLVSGDWKNAKYRLVGSVRQRTAAVEAGALLRVSATTPGSFSVELTKPKSVGFQVIRLAYKEKWSDLELNASASAQELPEGWSSPDNVHGAYQETSDASEESIRVTFSGLLPATRYEIVAYGFNIGPNPGTKLASAMARTGGFASHTTIAKCVAVDHRGLLQIYVDWISDQATGAQVINQAASFNPDLYRIRQVIGSDEGDDLGSDPIALGYLIMKDSATFDSWQEQLNDTKFVLFLKMQDKDLPHDLEEELDADPALFQRGDSDRNGVLEISDAIRTLQYLFLGNTELHCKDAADSNDNGEVEIGDAVFLLSYLYSSGSDPGAPHGACGADPTLDTLDCAEYSGCIR